MSLKAKLEALIYAAEEPITLDQLASLLKEDLLALKTASAFGSSGENGESQPAVSHDAPVEQDPGATAASKRAQQKLEKAELRALLKPFLDALIAESAHEDRGIEVRQVAGGYRMSTKPEHHDVVRAFAKSLKPPIRLSLPALETLAVIAYKQPVTVPEIGEIRGVDASAVIGTLLDRKLVTTAGRKAVVGRPMLYKTSKDFLLRFGLKDLSELPSLEEFEKLAAAGMEEDLASPSDAPLPDATGVPDENGGEAMAEDQAAAPENATGGSVSSDPRHDSADDPSGTKMPENNGG
jgi:segregation and condensation protein B